MSLVLTHFAVGAIMTALLVHLFFHQVKHKLILIVGGGLWGTIPDAHGVLPVYAEVFERLDASPWADIFWFHRTMDRIETGAGSPRLALGLAIILVLVIAATEWHDIRAGNV